MSSRIYKNHQVHIGVPFYVKNTQIYRNFDGTAAKIEANKNDEAFFDPVAEAEERSERILAEARQEAARIIEDAKCRAEEIVASAEADAERIKDEAEKKGKQDGYKKGLEEAKDEFCNILGEIGKIRDQARKEYGLLLDSAEADIIHMVLDIARKVIETEVSVNREYLLEIIKNAILRCTDRDNIILKVSPHDFDFVLESREKLNAMVDGIEEMEIRKEASLARGSCVVETRYGIIDAGINTKMDKIVEEFNRLISAEKF